MNWRNKANRLRVDELRELLEQAGFRILCLEATIDPKSLQVLRNGQLPLDRRFKDKSPETNASRNAWVAAVPVPPGSVERKGDGIGVCGATSK